MSFHNVKWIVSAVVIAALPVAALAQETKAKKYADVSGWTVESYAVDGQYMRCGAVVPASVGSKVSFEKSSEGWTLLVPTKAKGDTVKGAVDIDGKSFSGEFNLMDDNRVGLFLKPAQLKSVQGGKAMIVKIGAEQTPVPLTGIGAVISKITECDKKNSQ